MTKSCQNVDIEGAGWSHAGADGTSQSCHDVDALPIPVWLLIASFISFAPFSL